MSRIARVAAREILDSRGKPTLEVDVATDSGAAGRFQVPSGASVGRFEACELRDGDPSRLEGLGVLRAVDNVRAILGPSVIGCDPADQRRIDARLRELDGTADKSRLGANALLGVSLACAHAAAAEARIPLVRHLHRLWTDLAGPSSMSIPLPMVNMISGGLHAGRQLEFQDFLIVPLSAPHYRAALDRIVAVYRSLGRVLRGAGHEGYLVGDEGGYAPRLADNQEAVEFVMRGIEAAGLRPGVDVGIALDAASTHFLADGRYALRLRDGRHALTAAELTDLWAEWIDAYPLLSLEDPLSEEDWDGWSRLTGRLGHRVQVLGDDLFTTHSGRLQKGIELGAANSILIKMNQAGTLSETLDTMLLARRHGYRTIVSARSGETEDATMADLAVATGAGQIKIGSVARSERLAKYNQLLRLEEALAGEAELAQPFPGGRLPPRTGNSEE